ncbi:MAG TPA: (deoxy)nucleoside triphosphate pyrophosphohydrolase [Bryobacteraceae bacterium]
MIELDSRILIAQRKSDGAHPLKWEFPGGKVEPDELPAAALVRELQEELAIRARIGPEIMRYEYEYPNAAPILLIFYRVVEFDGEPINLNFERIEWVEKDRLGDFDFLEGDKDFLSALRYS